MSSKAACLSCLFAWSVIASVAVFADDNTGIEKRTGWSSSRIHGAPEPPPPFQAELAFPKLKFSRPLDISHAPGTDRLFVAEQAGKIYSFLPEADVASADLVIDLKQHHEKLRAIYGMTFHPDFATNRFVYVCYVDRSLDRDVGTRVARFRMQESDPPTIDPASEQPIIHWRSGGHNGCCLKFGPDGCLYISAGDSEVPTPPDPRRTGQDISNLMSSIMRIDVDHPQEGMGYSIPADNPFVSVEGARGEVWAYGFRNPWRMSFDRVSGELWVGDVGWELWEMIHRVRPGGNYGWSVMEGPQPILTEQKRGPTPILPPAIEHPHSEAGSITGGFVYHGQQLSDLKGRYIYGDFQSGIVWAAEFNDETVLNVTEIARTPLQLVAFAEDKNGELLLLDLRDQIYRLVPNPEEDRSHDFPRNLSRTGLFEDVETQRPAPGVISYSINAHHWADHTRSERWMAVPGSDPISVDDKGNWIFPDGSVLAKTVTMDNVLFEGSAGKEARSQRLETQILHRENGTWRPYTYAWNAEQTDAELVDSAGFSRDLQMRDADAPHGIRKQTWRFAARRECQLCHNPWVEAQTTIFGLQSASPLAVNAQQLRCSHGEGETQESQLAAWRQIGLLDEKLMQAVADVEPFADPYDASADINHRARAWLHVNCSYCHQFNAGGAATISLSHNVALEKTKTLNERPTQGTFRISDARIIQPGDPHGSVLYYRISKRGGGRMPRVGSSEVDVRGTQMIHSWIARMPVSDRESSTSSAIVAELPSRLNSADAEHRSKLIDELTSTTRGALVLLSLIDAAVLSPDVRAAVVEAASDHTQPEIRDLFERFVPADRRVKRLGTVVDRSDILNLKADVARGRSVYFNSTSAACINCHKLEDRGHQIGPDLSHIGKKYKREQLLMHILEPSRFMEPKYVPWLVETVKGRVYSGLLESQSDEAVVLKDAKGKLHTFPSSEIEELVRQQKSIMPELLLKDMTAQEVADLLAFLASLK